MNRNQYMEQYMGLALKLAEKGLFTTGVNPRVGCVIVKDNKIIGKGYHKKYGQAHAEVFALAEAGKDAKGSTVFVTLEPCSHVGKNPPCADALIKASVKQVVICNSDPNPLVAGKGVEKLEKAGIRVVQDVLGQQGFPLNIGFFQRMQFNVPWVRLKMAQSLDGRTAMKNGDSVWITGEHSRRDVQYWRARSQAILTGIKTVMIDDCRLTVRPESFREKHKKLPNNFYRQQPMRVILDTQLQISVDASILRTRGRCVIMTASNDHQKILWLNRLGAETIQMPLADDGKIDLKAVLKWLGEEKINELLVEAGATLAGQFLQQKLINELIIYTAPVIMGSSARPLFELDIEEMNKRLHINVFKMEQLGEDWRINATF